MIDQFSALKLINDIASRRKMGGVFGKSKKPVSRVTEQDKAVLVSIKHKFFYDKIVLQDKYINLFIFFAAIEAATRQN